MVLNNFVYMGKIVATKGLKGHVKLQCFSDNHLNMTNYDLVDKKGSVYKLSDAYIHKNLLIATVNESKTIAESTALVGLELYLSRDQMPILESDNYYINDIIGATVIDSSNQEMGKVKTMHNFGAGDLIEVVISGKEIIIPFTKHSVPEVNLEKKYVKINSEDLKNYEA